MKTIGRFILDRNLIFTGALILGLVAPGAAGYLRPLLFPVLGLIIVISAMSIGAEAFRPPRGVAANALIGVAANYVLMTGVIIAADLLLVSDPELKTGFFLVAAIPPAVAIIPFTEILGGNRALSLFGVAGGFVAAFLMLPLITLVFIGSNVVMPKTLVLILTGLIIVPVLVSRLLRAVHLDRAVGPYRGPITNLCFGIVFYIMVAANHDGIVRQVDALATLVTVGLLIMAVSGGIVAAAGRLFSAGRRTQVSLLLLATLKNYAVSAGLGLVLFSERTALPSVVMTVIMIPYIIVLDLLFGFQRKKDKPH